jgi:hypothetical protein
MLLRLGESSKIYISDATMPEAQALRFHVNFALDCCFRSGYFESNYGIMIRVLLSKKFSHSYLGDITRDIRDYYKFFKNYYFFLL